MALDTADKKQQAEDLARLANARLHKILDAEHYEENKDLSGKTYRHRNSFSSPEKPRDSWWLYTKVLSVDAAGMLKTFVFEIEKYGYHKVGTHQHIYVVYGVEISAAKFNKAWRDFQKSVASMKP